jgi:hypothetical protein
VQSSHLQLTTLGERLPEEEACWVLLLDVIAVVAMEGEEEEDGEAFLLDSFA